MNEEIRDRGGIQGCVLAFSQVGRHDIDLVGGKNASLGEMINKLAPEGIVVPPGFAITAKGYWLYVDTNDMRNKISDLLREWQTGKTSLSEASGAIRNLFLRGYWIPELAAGIWQAYRTLSSQIGSLNSKVAVRSSATAEDLPGASFAGQQESYLNITGGKALLDACKRCYASLFTERAMSYRQTKGFDHMSVSLSIGVQQMVRSDRGGAGVMFTIDTESGFDKVVLINAAWGLGENVVQGTVDTDEYQVYKPLLHKEGISPIIEQRKGEKAAKMVYGDKKTPTRNVSTSRQERACYVLSEHEILQLARWACIIEQHYGSYMDIEWAKDGSAGGLYIVKARPETIHAARLGKGALKRYSVGKHGSILAKGSSVGEAAASGRACLLESAADKAQFVDGAILVTQTTDPDWVPLMK